MTTALRKLNCCHTRFLPANKHINTMMDRQLAARVARAVQDTFAALPKTGKPQPNEHTVMAGLL